MLFSRMRSTPALRTIRGPSTAANSAGITGVPFSHRNASPAYSISASKAKGRACACQPVSEGASVELTEGANVARTAANGGQVPHECGPEKDMRNSDGTSPFVDRLDEPFRFDADPIV